MNEGLFRIVELAGQGFFCSQILLQMGLDALGRENPELIKAIGGLPGGLGFCGKNCGALTGGACLISLYAGKGTAEETPDIRLNEMISKLVNWFDETYGSVYGGINCRDIIENNPANMKERCPQMVLATYEKVKEILIENQYNLSTGYEGQ
ncbi:MAG TPA: C-GCAxxG-C-C family protein [Spirochaetota bacterium]|mgnify:CR=1 FL=1|nr:C-GCAxxG-C-C family protein [Spirochaetota bacterium]HPJ36724.1 C-GCAxxG-C-C family protein [Spirochaetota bacterium]HRX49021.1 C-GCAxxG-C-C family protein [Spirochaetota bacterium]